MNKTELEKKLKQYEAAFYLCSLDLVFPTLEGKNPFVEWINLTDKCVNIGFDFHAIVNDTFGYSCADGEKISLEECELIANEIKDNYPEGKEWIAIALFVQKKRNGLPFIKEVQQEIDNFFKKNK